MKDTKTDQLAREVARLTGETMTDAGRVAVLPVLDARAPDDILGYDDNGLPA